jgi:hypothetical protein
MNPSRLSREIQKLPRLGALNPDAALLIGQQIDDWIPRSNGGARTDRDLAADHAQTHIPRRSPRS